ncbi:response regulator transcription factor [Microbacterium sp. 18062]|uniref:response regulator transcription factor n=1 Tax=Microbacterium sp. 18062 TaxID=2681410 RepID=UPI00135721C4|nr:response regulator transcription factor [Microbacterium sp. 18062]
MTAIRVLIADDEPAIRSSLRLLVDSDVGMEVVGEAGDGEAAVESATRLCPDVVLMDVQMPRMTGLEATRALVAEPDGPRVIVLTMFDLDEYVYEALRVGASGFLLKNSPPSEVLHAIRVAHEGNALLAPEVTKRLIGRFAPPREDHRLDHLTERERETLALIGQGRSNAEIAAELFVTVTTVRTYVSRILTKLQTRDRAGLVVIAYESGIVTPTS